MSNKRDRFVVLGTFVYGVVVVSHGLSSRGRAGHMANEGKARQRQGQKDAKEHDRAVLETTASRCLDALQHPVRKQVQDGCDECEVDDAHERALPGALRLSSNDHDAAGAALSMI